MSVGTLLPGLPGAVADPGTGEVVTSLVDGLLADSGDLVEHRTHRDAWYGELVGPLRVTLAGVPTLLEQLQGRDHGLPVLIVATPGGEGDHSPLGQLRAARAALLDDDRVHIVGAEIPLPALADPAAAARVALTELDSAAPAWLVVPPAPEWLPALDVIAEDGAEKVALQLPPGADLTGAGAWIRRAVDLDLSFGVTAGELPAVTGEGGTGLLNLLGAVRAALNGAEADEVGAILASDATDPLCAAARRMSEADAAVVRVFLPLLTAPSARATVAELELLGLVAPDAA